MSNRYSKEQCSKGGRVTAAASRRRIRDCVARVVKGEGSANDLKTALDYARREWRAGRKLGFQLGVDNIDTITAGELDLLLEEVMIVKIKALPRDQVGGEHHMHLLRFGGLAGVTFYRDFLTRFQSTP